MVSTFRNGQSPTLSMADFNERAKRVSERSGDVAKPPEKRRNVWKRPSGPAPLNVAEQVRNAPKAETPGEDD